MSLGIDYLRSLLEEDAAKGVYRCRREMFTDPRLFDLEMTHIFEGNWVYLAHESQIPEKNDFLTTMIGRQSVSSRATRTACSTPSSTPAATRAPCSAGKSPATVPATPARSTAGPSTIPASCSR